MYMDKRSESIITALKSIVCLHAVESRRIAFARFEPPLPIYVSFLECNSAYYTRTGNCERSKHRYATRPRIDTHSESVSHSDRWERHDDAVRFSSHVWCKERDRMLKTSTDPDPSVGGVSIRRSRMHLIVLSITCQYLTAAVETETTKPILTSLSTTSRVASLRGLRAKGHLDTLFAHGRCSIIAIVAKRGTQGYKRTSGIRSYRNSNEQGESHRTHLKTNQEFGSEPCLTRKTHLQQQQCYYCPGTLPHSHLACQLTPQVVGILVASLFIKRPILDHKPTLAGMDQTVDAQVEFIDVATARLLADSRIQHLSR
ncbi:hypothetical protein BDY19DRAFT_910407 [Irpex rosettiformis]|uniref:Uncharacterized protein n=1 Tax=Irpex rosettiformis TaxID=378272 RepID=A0ACB8TP05_9APHY|nr:hypothetical protein BDY19DRAFT_910407 [Irpex rosettiformis]